jgi:hypothetical protein
MRALAYEAHVAIAFATPLVFVLAALWGIWEYRHGKRLSRWYDRSLWALQVVLFIQVMTGVVLLLAGRSPGAGAHVVSGSLVAVLPLLVWIAARQSRYISLYLGLTCAVMAAFGVQAITTGG